MPVHNYQPPRGRIDRFTISSQALQGNLLGDPDQREVAVYLPAGYDDTDADYPMFLDLAGFTGSGLKRVAWQPFGESVPQRADRLVETGKMGPAVFVFPDGFTSLGGNQYVDSPVMGAWEQFLVDELLPAVEQRYRVRHGPAHRAVYGKSSGGYGALVQGMLHGGSWGAVASHSGDVGFDWVYRCDLPACLEALKPYEMSPVRFMEALKDKARISGGEFHALMTLAMAASYDPDPSAPLGIRLPMDTHTCELIPERWEQWLTHDPVRMVEEAACRESLAGLKMLFIDCGAKDQYRIQYGTRALVRKLEKFGIGHIHEEFDDGHSGIEYRLDRSLPLLYRAVAGSS
jgi:hypothetical protein